MFLNILLWVATFALNLLLTPKPQNAKPAGLDEFDFPTAEPGRSIPVLFGTKVISGPNVVWYGDLYPEAIKGARRYGFFGPRSTTGYKYYLGIHMVMCHGVVDFLRGIEVDGKWLWRGWQATTGVITITKPEFFGGADGGGGIGGFVGILMGEPTQTQTPYLQSVLGTDVPAFRGVFSAVLARVYLGNSPYILPWDFRIQRVFKTSSGTDQWYTQTAGIGYMDVSDTAIYFAIDVSGSMYWENDIDVERQALNDLLDLVQVNYPTGNLDIRMVAWDHEVKSFIERRNIQPAQFDDLRNWVDVEMNGGGGTDFAAGLLDAAAFFEGTLDGGLYGNVTTLGAEEKRRVLIFTTDGDPNDPASSDVAVGLLEAIDRLEVYTFNISSGLTQYIEPLDNTGSDWSQEVYSAQYLPSNALLDVGFFLDPSQATRRMNKRSPAFTDGEVAEYVVALPYEEAPIAPHRFWVLFRTQNDDDEYVIRARQYAMNSSDNFTFATYEDFEISTEPGRNASGNHLVWIDYPDKQLLVNWTDDDDNIVARRFRDDNTGDAAPFQVNLTGSGDYSRGVGLEDQGFIVVWQASPSGIYGNRILGRRYDLTATAVTGELDLTVDASGSDHDKPGVCRRADGTVVLAWITDGETIYQSILDPDASLAVLSTDVVGPCQPGRSFSIAALTGGGHVFVFSLQAGDLRHYVYYQLYDDDGVKVGTATRVSSFAKEELEPSVSGLVGGARDGGFVVAWQVKDQDGDGWGVYSRQFDSAGTPSGVPLNAATFTEFDQRFPGVSTSPHGKFVVGWQDTNMPATPVLTHGATNEMRDTIARAFNTHHDMNPAHIIRECLTDRVWGMGYNESDVDDDSFTYAADYLFGESFGLSLLWDAEQEIEQFITTILSHIDAMLFVSRETGRFTLKLIRPDYDINDIYVATEDVILDWSDCKRRQPTEAVNSVKVVYHEKLKNVPGTVQVHNAAAVEQLGGMIATTREYVGITRRALAIRVATRDLRTLGSGMASGTLIGNRNLERLQPGEPFRIFSERQGFTGEVMRAMEIIQADGRDNEVRVRFVQDVFGLPDEVLVDDSESDYQLPNSVEPVEVRLVEEMPYHQLRIELGEVEVETFLDQDETSGLLLAAGVNPGGAFGAVVRIDVGAGYEDAGTLSFCPGGLLLAELKPLADETSITITDGVGLSLVTVGTLVAIGDEIARVSSIASSPTFVIERGCEDTVPRLSAAGASVLFFDLEYFPDMETRTDGTVAEVRLQTIMPRVGTLDLASAPADIVTFAHRAVRPYPVGRLKVEGSYRPTTLSGTADLTWKTRDRLVQSDIVPFDTNTDYGPEGGTTYNLEVFGIDNAGVATSFYTTTGLTGTSYSFNTGTNPPPVGSEAIRLDLTTVRDGYLSWQAAQAFCPLSALSITGTPPSTGFTGTSYDFVPATTGGVPAYVFTISAGTLPTGLGVNAFTGEISGVPSAAGTFSGIVLTVTDLLGHTDSLGPFTITILSGSLPDPIIVLDFIAGVYSIDGVVVPYTDLLDDVDPTLIETAQGLQAFDGDNHYPQGTTLFKDRLYALIQATGYSMVMETDFDGNVTDPYAIGMYTFADPAFGDWNYSFANEMYVGVYYPGGFAGNRFEPFLRSSTYNRGVFTVDRQVSGEYWAEYAVQGTLQGRGYFGDYSFFTDTVDETTYMNGSIDALYIGSSPSDYFNFSNVFIRRIIIYPALPPTQQAYVAAQNMTWESVNPYHLPWTTTGVDYEFRQTWIDSLDPIPPGYGSKVWAFGGAPPATFSISSGSLPPGLSLDSSFGYVYGASTTTGDYTYSITAADSSTNTDDFPLTTHVYEHFMALESFRRFQDSALPSGGFISYGDASNPDWGYETPTIDTYCYLLAMHWQYGNLVYDTQYAIDGGSATVMDEVLTQTSLVGWRFSLGTVKTTIDRIYANWAAVTAPTANFGVTFRMQASGFTGHWLHDDVCLVWSPVEMRPAGVQIYNAYQGQTTALDPVLAAPAPANGFVVAWVHGAGDISGPFYKEEYRGNLIFSGTNLFARFTCGPASDPTVVLTGTSLNFTNMYGAALGIQPKDMPFLAFSSPAASSSTRNYNVDLRQYSFTAGDRLVAFVMHRTSLTQLPEDWRLVDTVTSTKTGATQLISVYERRARSAEPAWETWQQTSNDFMAVQVLVGRSDLGYLSVVDSAVDNSDSITSNANLMDVAEITATADGQMAMTSAASINSDDTAVDGNYIAVLSGLWNTSHHYMQIFSSSDAWQFGWMTRLSTGWRSLMSGDLFSGSFKNFTISPTTQNGLATVTALLDQAPLAISGDVNLVCVKDSAYAGFTVTGIQGTAPYTYSVSSGSLPAGLSLDTGTGAVTGTPTTIGVYQFTLRVTDNAALTADMTRTLIVGDGVLNVTLVHTATSTSTNPTFSSVNFGAVHDNRHLVITLTCSDSAGTNLAMPTVTTIGGATAVELLKQGHLQNFHNTTMDTVVNAVVAIAHVPTGTSGSIVVSGSKNRWSLAVYRAVNLASIALVDGDTEDAATITSGNNRNTLTVDAPSPAFVVVAGVRFSNTSFTFTNTPTLTTDLATTAGTNHYGIHYSSSSVTGTVTTARPTGFSGPGVVMAVLQGNAGFGVGAAAGVGSASAVGTAVRASVGAAAGTSTADAAGSPGIYERTVTASGIGSATAFGTRTLTRITADSTLTTADETGTTADRGDAPAGLATGRARVIGQSSVLLHADVDTVTADNVEITADDLHGYSPGAGTAPGVGSGVAVPVLHIVGSAKGTGAPNMTATIPAATGSGDLMVFGISYDILHTLTPAAGWTFVNSVQATGTTSTGAPTNELAVYTKTATGSDAGATTTWNVAGNNTGLLVVVRGGPMTVATSNTASVNNSSGTTGAIASVTGTDQSQMALTFYANAPTGLGSDTPSVSSGFTMIENFGVNGTIHVTAFKIINASDVASSTVSWVNSLSNVGKASVTLLIDS